VAGPCGVEDSRLLGGRDGGDGPGVDLGQPAGGEAGEVAAALDPLDVDADVDSARGERHQGQAARVREVEGEPTGFDHEAGLAVLLRLQCRRLRLPERRGEDAPERRARLASGVVGPEFDPPDLDLAWRRRVRRSGLFDSVAIHA
jgi:hypothetical protein